jgi:hypothetical protein
MEALHYTRAQGKQRSRHVGRFEAQNLTGAQGGGEVKLLAFAMGKSLRESAIQRSLATHAPSIFITQGKVKGQIRTSE